MRTGMARKNCVNVPDSNWIAMVSATRIVPSSRTSIRESYRSAEYRPSRDRRRGNEGDENGQRESPQHVLDDSGPRQKVAGTFPAKGASHLLRSPSALDAS